MIHHRPPENLRNTNIISHAVILGYFHELVKIQQEPFWLHLVILGYFAESATMEIRILSSDISSKLSLSQTLGLYNYCVAL